MPDNTTVYVGTVGQSIWRSDDGGLTFRRASVGVHSECDVRALLIDPRDPNLLHLGTETGLFVSEDGARRWNRVESPMDQTQLGQIFGLTQTTVSRSLERGLNALLL